MIRFSIAVLWLLIVAAVALVALAPATWLDRRIAAASAGALRLSDAEGTVWRGRGALGDTRGTWRIPVVWRISPLPLLRGTVDIELGSSADPDAGRGQLLLENDSAELRNVALRVPASALGTLAGTRLPVEPGGELILDAPQFRYRPNQTDGAFDVRWQRARLATAGSAVDLGTVTAHVAPQGSALVGVIGNVGGDARIDGDVSVSASGIAVRANIAPGPNVPPDIARMLAALGAPDANGIFHLQWSARR
jgi:general secretion pathway protein N